jgi:sugar-specific transcriptional regulator TrmB
LSLEQIVKILSGLGLTRLDSKIYICLNKNGPAKDIEISKRLKIQNDQLYISLKKLENKGIIKPAIEQPRKFKAVSLNEVYEIFIKSKLTEAQRCLEQKNCLKDQIQALAC